MPATHQAPRRSLQNPVIPILQALEKIYPIPNIHGLRDFAALSLDLPPVPLRTPPHPDLTPEIPLQALDKLFWHIRCKHWARIAHSVPTCNPIKKGGISPFVKKFLPLGKTYTNSLKPKSLASP
jgi:hypothetical protein